MADTTIHLDRLRLGLCLMRLAKMEANPIARTLHGKVVRAWDPMYGPHRSDRRYCSVVLKDHEVEIYQRLKIPPMLTFTYAALYVDPQDPTVEVIVRSEKYPPAKATFNVRGGKRRLTRKSIEELENTMARKTASVDELDDLDDLDLDDDEDEAPAPKPKKAAKETAAEKRRRVKAEAAAAAEAEDDEDAEDEDEADVEDDEDEEPVKPAKKKVAKPAAKAKAKGEPVGRALPEGKLGVEDVAKLAGTTGRAVRIYCRTNEVEKAPGLGRYAWTEKQGTALAKRIKAGSK